jgi:hypothetical protein
MGSITLNGYGRIWEDGRHWLVHREAYEAIYGNIPAELQIDHKCRVRSCCNPSHLEAVTPKENALRGESRNARNARKTHCKNGHLLAGDNLYTRKDRPGYRECRICRNTYAAEYNKTYVK